MVLVPLIDLLETLLYWALRYAVLALVIAAINAIGGLGFGLGWLARALRSGLNSLVHLIEEAIAKAALAAEGVTVNFVLGVAARIEHSAFSAWYTAHRTLEALEILVGSEIPRYVAGALSGTGHLIGSVTKAVIALEHGLARDVGALRAHARAIEAQVARALVTAEKAFAHAVAVTIPAALPWVDKRAGAAEAAAEKALRGVRDLRNVIAGAVFAGLVWKALGRLGVPRNNCSNVREFNKRLCGGGPGGLSHLLDALTLIVGTVSLLEFAKACQTVETEIIDGVHSFLRP